MRAASELASLGAELQGLGHDVGGRFGEALIEEAEGKAAEGQVGLAAWPSIPGPGGARPGVCVGLDPMQGGATVCVGCCCARRAHD